MADAGNERMSSLFGQLAKLLSTVVFQIQKCEMHSKIPFMRNADMGTTSISLSMTNAEGCENRFSKLRNEVVKLHALGDKKQREVRNFGISTSIYFHRNLS